MLYSLNYNVMKQKINLIKTGLYSLFLCAACGCGVNPNIFSSMNLHPCGTALSNLIANSSGNTDSWAAVCTYEGEQTPGHVFIWISAKNFLSTKGEPTQSAHPDYDITGIKDPEAVTFDKENNLYISSPSQGYIYYINVRNLPSATPNMSAPINIDGTQLSSYQPSTFINNTYTSPRGLTFDPDDGNLYVVMEYPGPSNNNSTSAIVQIKNPATANPTGTLVSTNFSDTGNGSAGQPNDVAEQCLGIAYSHAHQCFFLTDLYNQRLHQLSWGPGQSATNTTGNSLAEPNPAIVMPDSQYCFDVGISIDPTSQDSIYCTSSDGTTKCQLNGYAYANWNSYANYSQTVSSVRTLDAPTPAPSPQYDAGYFVAWGVTVMVYKENTGQTLLHEILVDDAPQNKVVSFSTP